MRSRRAARERLKPRRARSTDLQAGIVALGKPLTLFKASRNLRETKKGVTARVYGERQLYPSTFVATMASGHKGVFKRVRGEHMKTRLEHYKPSKHTQKIDELFGPSVPDALDYVKRNTTLPSELSADAVKKISREIDRELQRQAGKHKR